MAGRSVLGFSCTGFTVLAGILVATLRRSEDLLGSNGFADPGRTTLRVSVDGFSTIIFGKVDHAGLSSDFGTGLYPGSNSNTERLSLVRDSRLFCSEIERLCPGGSGRLEKIPKSNLGNGRCSGDPVTVAARFITGAESAIGFTSSLSTIVGFIAGLGLTLEAGLDPAAELALEDLLLVVVLDPLLEDVPDRDLK